MSDDDTIGPLPSEMILNSEDEDTNSGEQKSKKRRASDDERDDVVGPLPTEMQRNEGSGDEADPPPAKQKKKILKNEAIFLRNIPTAQYYEVSYMHRNVITHVVYTKYVFTFRG
ncbi:unnamed protein product [Echinostoma caproni]|uniref:AMPKBI domain-containing protein n=1 Tax=Echinostoma caproni TaxID=27848 RepID=A0A183B1T2_9TREM|nr:unnamed protein product [Echinostoma caproni]